MAKQLDVMAAVYADEDRASVIIDMLWQMHRGTTINLEDAAVITKGADGKLKIRETKELTTRKGAKRGAIAAGVVGLIFPPSLLVTAAAGGALGAAWGKLRDTGIKNSALKDIGDKLEPGKAAVVALVEHESVPAAERALQGYDGELLRYGFNAADTAEIEAASTPNQ